MLYFKQTILLFFITFFSYSQTDTIRGKILEVDYTKSQIILTVQNDSTGIILKISTSKYIRGQNEFYIQGDTINILPPPLHITNFWVTEEKMYIETSEPVTITLYNRNYGWYGTGVPWGKQELLHPDGYQMAQAFEFNKKWFTTETNINTHSPSPDNWDFAIELHPIRTKIEPWSIWMHYRTFYFSMYNHL